MWWIVDSLSLHDECKHKILIQGIQIGENANIQWQKILLCSLLAPYPSIIDYNYKETGRLHAILWRYQDFQLAASYSKYSRSKRKKHIVCALKHFALKLKENTITPFKDMSMYNNMLLEAQYSVSDPIPIWQHESPLHTLNSIFLFNE